MPLPSEEAGTGPAVVLLHAGVCDRTMWREHLTPLAAAGYRAVALDLPGYGEAPAATADSAWLDVVATMDALGIDRATLVGNSFGGAVALRVSVTAPERVGALVLISTPPVVVDPSPQLRAAWEAEGAALDRGDVEAAVTAVVEAWTRPGAPPELRERVAAMQRRALLTQLAAPDPAQVPDPLKPDMLTGIGVPTLVAVGVDDMPDFLEAAESMAAAMPDARLARIEGAGHLAPLETPDRFRALLTGFLAR